APGGAATDAAGHARGPGAGPAAEIRGAETAAAAAGHAGAGAASSAAAAAGAVFDRPSMMEFLKNNRGAVFMQVGFSLYAMYEALKSQAEGDQEAVWDEAKTQAWEGVLYTGMPLALEYAAWAVAAPVASWGACLLGLEDLGLGGYAAYQHWRLSGIWVEPRITPRLAGVLPDGSRLEAPDVITTLGVPRDDADFAAPRRYVDGVFGNGTMRVRHEENGTIVVEKIDPAVAAVEREQAVLRANGATRFMALSELPPNPVLQTWSYTPGQLVAEQRLNRAFDLLRREYRAEHPGLRPVSALLDLRKMGDPYHLDFDLAFERPVDPNELLYYLKRYRAAVTQSGVEFNDATSIFRQAPNGYQLEVELGDAVTRKFLEEMGKRAAEADAARRAYDEAGPLALQAQLDAGQTLHIDGRDLTREEVQQRIAAMTAEGLRRARAANPIWLAWLRKHWGLDSLEIPDLRNTQCSISSFTAVPNAELGEGSFRLVLKYQLNKKPEGGIQFYTIEQGREGEPHYDMGLIGDPEKDKDLSAPGARTFVTGAGADIHEGTDRTFSILIATSDYDPVTRQRHDRTLAQSAPITLKGERKKWMFEKLVQTGGVRSYHKNVYGDSVWFDVAIEGSRLTLTGHSNGDQGSWDESVMQVGPLPMLLENFKQAGFWVVSQRSRHPYFIEWRGKMEEHSAPSFLMDFGDDTSGWREGPKSKPGDSTLVIVPAGLRESAQRELGLTEPPPFTGEDGRQYTGAYAASLSERYTFPRRLRAIANVRLNGPGQGGGFRYARFEWTWRLANPGEILPTDSPLSMTRPGTTSAGATPTSGAGAGNPWGASLETATAATGPWGASLATAQGGAGGAGAAGAAAGAGGPQASLSPAPPSEPTPEQMLASPAPWLYPAVQAAMDEWLRSARPPIADGTPWRYTEWGVMENRVGVTALHPDNQGMTRHQWLWERCRRLTSSDHCTLGEFVRLRLTGAPLDGCRGKGPAARPAPSAASSAPPAPPGRPLASGDAAPAFEAHTLDGKQTIRLEDLRGKTVLLSLWNPTSPADRGHYGLISGLFARYSQIAVLSTAPGYENDLKRVHAFVDTLRTRVHELVPDPKALAPYLNGVIGTPTTFVIDEKGVVRGVYTGSLLGRWTTNEEIGRVAGVLRDR
ncbi:MAG: redoxin domain-containing protein, partial [Candidatus Eisenbacteria bacterium]|nr:redoxin domain-containing protein [Candidatus Eisenbacteria bacterium]